MEKVYSELDLPIALLTALTNICSKFFFTRKIRFFTANFTTEHAVFTEISKLLERKNEEKIEEVIIAVKPSIEGETTALYITRMLKDTGVKVSKIAHGVPLGAEMEYLDSLTLEVALENRNIISS